MKCKTCEKGFTPPRKNILNCSKCIIFRKAKSKAEEGHIKDESESEQNDDEESDSDDQDDEEYKQKHIEHLQLFLKQAFMW